MRRDIRPLELLQVVTHKRAKQDSRQPVQLASDAGVPREEVGPHERCRRLGTSLGDPLDQHLDVRPERTSRGEPRLSRGGSHQNVGANGSPTFVGPELTGRVLGPLVTAQEF